MPAGFEKKAASRSLVFYGVCGSLLRGVLGKPCKIRGPKRVYGTPSHVGWFFTVFAALMHRKLCKIRGPKRGHGVRCHVRWFFPVFAVPMFRKPCKIETDYQPPYQPAQPPATSHQPPTKPPSHQHQGGGSVSCSGNGRKTNFTAPPPLAGSTISTVLRRYWLKKRLQKKMCR